MLKIDIENNKGLLLVKLDGSLNRITSYKINNYLVPVIIKHKIKSLMLNIQKITDVDDDGIESINNIKYAVKNNKGNIYLYQSNNYLEKKLNKLHLKKVKSNEKALELIGAK